LLRIPPLVENSRKIKTSNPVLGNVFAFQASNDSKFNTQVTEGEVERVDQLNEPHVPASLTAP